MLTAFHWLAKTGLGVAMQDSTWAFAIVEIVHLLALAVFGGAILMVDLRLIGVGLKNQSASRIAQELFPIVLIGMATMLISGFLLLASGPMRYYYNPAFRIKMWLFLIAVIFHIALQRWVSRSDSRQSIAQTAAAVVSMLLWLSIGLAGRAIGYV
jgi:hypothetical protein